MDPTKRNPNQTLPLNCKALHGKTAVVFKSLGLSLREHFCFIWGSRFALTDIAVDLFAACPLAEFVRIATVP